MKFRLDKGTGYLYSYNPNHYTANKAGKVLEHVYVMSKSIGRKLNKDECVHHIDRDKTNNHIDNLMLLTIAEHALLHQIEDNGYLRVSTNCDSCSLPFEHSKRETRVYCSKKCADKERKVFTISREDLYFLVWSKPTTEVANILGVSDVAVAKRCKKLNVPKPPRGYWAKINAGQQVEITPLPIN